MLFAVRFIVNLVTFFCGKVDAKKILRGVMLIKKVAKIQVHRMMLASKETIAFACDKFFFSCF